MGITGKTTRVELGTAEVELELPVASSPSDAYSAFVNDISRWWSRGYTMGGEKTTGLILEDEPGGRLLEQWGDRDGAIWALVIQVEQGRMIHLGIPEGVVWSGPGMIRVTFADGEDGTTLVQLKHTSTQLHSDTGHEGYRVGWTDLVMERFAKYAGGERVDDAVTP